MGASLRGKMMTTLFRRLFLALVALMLLGGPAMAKARPPVILISIDGFRADYTLRGKTPTLAALAAEGAQAGEGMRPSFPANTFPNHYTLITGLRPDRSGLTDNTMYDVARPGVKFSMSARDQVQDRFWWDGGEPVWVTAERKGIHSFVMYWPGSEAAIHGVRPSRWLAYDEKDPAFDRVDRLLGWLDLPLAERPGFMTLYLEEVDTTGHHDGPDSPALDESLTHVDAALARLVAGLKARGLYDKVNLVIVADHGMAEVDVKRRIPAEDWAPPEVARLVSTAAVVGFVPEPGHEAEARRLLVGRHPTGRCWEKGKVPTRFHYGTNRRIPAIVCLSDRGAYVVSRAAEAKRTTEPDHGSHGYDPYLPEMRALFVARGANIWPGVRVGSFDNVDIHPLLAALMGLTAPRSDGDPRRLAGLIRTGG